MTDLVLALTLAELKQLLPLLEMGSPERHECVEATRSVLARIKRRNDVPTPPVAARHS